MGLLKADVFGSPREREFYYKLAKTWEGKLKIWHNLHCGAVFDLSHPDIRSLCRLLPDRWEKYFFFNTSIDYVCCDLDDRPVLCIEYDGEGQGYNSGLKYYNTMNPRDGKRPRKLSLKLDLARRAGLPFFVVSYKHLKDLTPSTQLSIADGIIGDVLSSRAKLAIDTNAGVAERFRMSEEEFSRLPSEQQQQMKETRRQELYFEVEQELNPISKLFHEKWPFHYKVSIKSLPTVGLIKCSCILFFWDATVCGPSKEVAHRSSFTMPDFVASGFGSQELAKRIAVLIAFDEALRKGIKPRDVPDVRGILFRFSSEQEMNSKIEEWLRELGFRPSG